MTEKIIHRILKKTNVPDLLDLLVDKLTFGELQSLLLKVIERKTRKKNIKDVFSEYLSNRFVQPSDISPVEHRQLDLRIFSLLPADFELVSLAPLTPVGSSSVLTSIHQNNVISTIRNVEVAADTTNMLAFECAKRRKALLQKDSRNKDTVKLCASQLLTRGQPFENKDFSASFNVTGLCTAGQEKGHDDFALVNLEEHLMFYISILDEVTEKEETDKIIIKFFSRDAFDNSSLIGSIKNKLEQREDICFRTENNCRFATDYYIRLRFMIGIVKQDGLENIYIDGGFTEWTSRLLGNRKEKLLTSGIGTDFLLRTIKLKKSPQKESSAGI